MPHSRKIAVIGLGYVGLPVAVSFAASNVPVIGFDIDARRITELNKGHDRTNEVESDRLKQKSLTFTDDLRLHACIRLGTLGGLRHFIWDSGGFFDVVFCSIEIAGDKPSI